MALNGIAKIVFLKDGNDMVSLKEILMKEIPSLGEPKHIISLGAGVQSSTMSLMATHGEITPMPKAAVFADTGGEPRKVYTWLDWLEKQLPFPVYRVDNGNLKEDIIAAVENKKRFAGIPFYIKKENSNKPGMLRRQCTSEYKIKPVNKKIRELAGLVPGKKSKKISVVLWQGISLDEIQRARVSHDRWQEYRYPLIEQRISRQGCLHWMKKNNYPEPPRSACYFCPYRSNRGWQKMKLNDPESFLDAVRIDKKIRNGNGLPSLSKGSKVYLHKSMKPLDEIDFVKAKSRIQQVLSDEFEGECEGMCGM